MQNTIVDPKKDQYLNNLKIHIKGGKQNMDDKLSRTIATMKLIDVAYNVELNPSMVNAMLIYLSTGDSGLLEYHLNKL